MSDFTQDELERRGFFRVADYDATDPSHTPYLGYRCPACGGVHPQSEHMTGRGHAEGCWLNPVLKRERNRVRRQATEARRKELEQRGRDWDARNPDACPECYCRPGKQDSEQGTDHEKFCSRASAGS